MKVVHLLLYLAAGFMVRSVALLFFGSGGLVDYHTLEAQKHKLESNIQNLRELNANLLQEEQALGSDPERLALQARELGYFREGERVLLVDDNSPSRRHFTVGTLVRITYGRQRRDWIAKMLGLVVPVVLFVVRISTERRRRHASVNR
jgi:cell division protein FtsB